VLIEELVSSATATAVTGTTHGGRAAAGPAPRKRTLANPPGHRSRSHEACFRWRLRCRPPSRRWRHRCRRPNLRCRRAAYFTAPSTSAFGRRAQPDGPFTRAESVEQSISISVWLSSISAWPAPSSTSAEIGLPEGNAGSW
jgi:hypothetical protein